MKKSQTIDLFYPGLEGSPYYRIPVLCRTKDGKLVAAADQRLETESDWGGLIEPAIRIKENEGFSDIIKPFKAPRIESINPTYTIDTTLIRADYEENPQKLYMIIDKYRSEGNYLTAKKGTGYVEIDGEKCLILFYNSQNRLLFEKTDKRYYLKGEKVYDMASQKTPWTVKMDDSYPYDRLGNIYEDDKLLGNIYSDNSFLRVHQTSYLYFTYSEDGGRSWACPRDISMDVADDRMMFLGTSPGRGIQLPSGRLISPIYYTTDNADDIYDLREHAAVIYSDDFGKTWLRSLSVNDFNGYDSLKGYVPTNTSESQIVRLGSGTLIMFSRTTSDRLLYSYSYDGGESFSKNLVETDFDSEAFCMVSALKYEENNKEYILISNPKGPGRFKGYIRVLEVLDDESLRLVKEKQITDTNFTYSCLEETKTPGVFALLYEERCDHDGEEKEHLRYVEFDFDWVMT